MREASSVLANKKDTIEASTGLTADVEKPAESSPIIEVDITKRYCANCFLKCN